MEFSSDSLITRLDFIDEMGREYKNDFDFTIDDESDESIMCVDSSFHRAVTELP